MFVQLSREVIGVKVGVLLGFTEFYRVYYWVVLDFSKSSVLMFIQSSHEVAGLKVGVLLGFTEFYRVLPSFVALPSWRGLDGEDYREEEEEETASNEKVPFEEASAEKEKQQPKKK